jgi:hypothetical protein
VQQAPCNCQKKKVQRNAQRLHICTALRMYLHVPAALAADGGEGGEPVRLDPCALAAEGALGVVGSWDGWVEPLWFPRSGPGVVLRVQVPRPAPGVGGLVHYKFRTRSG